MTSGPFKKIRDTFREKSAPPDFSDFQLHRKINGFSSFDGDWMAKLKSDLGLETSVEELIELAAVLKAPPTVFALRIIDGYWNSPRAQFTRDIGEIYLSSENPHIRKAMTKYEELHRRFMSGSPRTIAGMQQVNVRAVAEDNRDSVLVSAGRVSEECAAYDKGRRIRYFAYLMTKWDDGWLPAERRAAVECTVAGAVPRLMIREEPGGNTPGRMVSFARYAESLDAAAYGAAARGVSGAEPMTKATVLGFSTFPQVGTGMPEKGDVIAVIVIPDTERASLNSLNAFLRELSLGGMVERALCNDNGMLNALIALGKGFDLELADAADLNMPPEEFITVGSLNMVTLAVRHGKMRDVKATAQKYSFDCHVVGRFTSEMRLRLFSKGAELAEVDMEILRYRNHTLSRYELGSRPEPFLAVRSDTADDIKRNVVNVSEGTPLNALGGGKTVIAQMSGAAQTTPNQISAVRPDFYGYGGAVNAAALSGHAAGGDLFTRAVNTALNAVLKLVVAGVSIYDIALNPAYLIPDAEECKGELLEEALGIFYAENALSLCSLGYSSGFGKSMKTPEVFVAATGMLDAGAMAGGSFKNGDKIYKIGIPRDEYGIPDFKFVLKLAAQININVTKGNVTGGRVVDGGAAEELIDATAGDRLGFSFSSKPPVCSEGGSDLLLAIEDAEEFSAFDPEYVGVVDDTGRIRSAVFNITHSELDRLVSRYPFENRPEQRFPVAPVSQKEAPRRASHVKMPRMMVIHTDRASEGAIAESAARRNFRVDSVYIGPNAVSAAEPRAIREKIASSDMLVIAGYSAYGGYAAADMLGELIENPVVTDAVNELIFRNEGLVLGTGAGAAVLAMTGLLSKGSTEHRLDAGVMMKPSATGESSAKIPRLRISNRFSPMLSRTELGRVYFAAAPGRNMRLVADKAMLGKLMSSGQIAAQFVDPVGMPTSAFPFNPTGSDSAIAALSSPDGRVLGFFALPEKTKYLFGERSLLEDMLDSAADYFGTLDF